MKNLSFDFGKKTFSTKVGNITFEARSVTKNSHISGMIWADKALKMSFLTKVIEDYLDSLTTPKQVGYTINKVVNTYGGVDFEATIE